MTVPGRGGRPRKWRSDADRVRAFRARQRGAEEPPTLETALDEGDELAFAIERGRQLQADLAQAIESLAEAEAEVQAERRRCSATQRKLDRARADLDALRDAVKQRDAEVHDARDELEAVRAENQSLRALLDRPALSPTGPNRAARRKAAKDDRRSSRER